MEQLFDRGDRRLALFARLVATEEQRRQRLDRGGELRVAQAQLGVRLVGQVPLVPELREGADSGDPIASRPDTEAGAPFAEMARVLDEEMRPSKRVHPELKLLS